jgi:Ca2+-binding RTX toxin-like protein
MVDAIKSSEITPSDSNSNTMFGGLGDDQMYGLDGDDSLLGDHGNDLIVGGKGDDTIVGHFGADRISGATGNDVIYHGGEGSFPDGSRDIIDCGDGNDEVWINISDRDVTRNCEIIHAG